ncbi:MAG: hypothetical protein FJ267_13170 [Planctomycetes bacterium]|nr:hypothetical protein [Planctomycetota bacterium]
MSVLLAFHVFAIFVAPSAMPPASALLEQCYNFALPYNEALFLNHGYHFFAPDPGSSSLMAYSIPQAGNIPLKKRIPDKSIWPRLLYHRYFMLAENVSSFSEKSQNEFYEAYARHFARIHNADRVTLYSVSHEPSSMARIQVGGRLDDPEMFSEEVINEYDLRNGSK